MSATINAGKFVNYFNDCPLVEIPGRNFSVKMFYLPVESAQDDICASAVGTVRQIQQRGQPGSVLVFMPGELEIRRVCGMIRERKDLANVDVFPLFSALPRSEQSRALEEPVPNRLKVIVATNIAETSLTIPGVVHVIDSGLCKESVYDPRLDLTFLQERPVSQASANQRAGRAGRTQDGICYRLYSKEAYHLMKPTADPAIVTQPLDSCVLQLIAAGRDLAKFDWLDLPAPETLARALQKLQGL